MYRSFPRARTQKPITLIGLGIPDAAICEPHPMAMPLAESISLTIEALEAKVPVSDHDVIFEADSRRLDLAAMDDGDLMYLLDDITKF
jgi:hypothetical protein